MSTDSGLGFVTGPLAGRVFPVGRRAAIGRDPAGDVVFPPETDGISTRHAQLTADPSGHTIVDLASRGGTFVDGRRLPPHEPVRVNAGAVVRFGASGPLAVFDAASRLRAGPRLVLARDDAGARWPLERPTLIGRDADCDVVLDGARDAQASARHAMAFPAFGRALVSDLGSANGTWLEGRRVADALVGPGDVVRLGSDGPALRVVAEGGGTPAPQRRPSSKVPAARASERLAAAAGPASSVRFEAFRLDVSSGGARGRVHVLVKTEVQLGGFGALNDIVLRCFPRELESDKDALERSESIGVEHLALRLTPKGVALCDLGGGPTKVNGRRLAAGEEVELDALTDVWVGDDVLGLGARLFSHPRLPPTPPALGQEHKHPVECVVLERKGDGADHLYVQLVRQASLGASDDAAIRLPLPGVAPQHALLFVKQGRVWLSQLGEAPVAVLGAGALRPGTAAPLEPGVRFFLGAATVEVAESSPADFDPV
ncbi:MAG: FHA domain-containing protein [Planctomycetes bacterium]|nr:FHA domain-containing protein [Planctomycetota bacterium]